MRAGERVGVAVSGGADSVALLRLLLEARDELGVVLSVVHFNHRLRGEESDGDEAFVRALAAEHGLEFLCESDQTRAHAAERKCGIEAAARELRYAFFRRLIAPQRTRGNAGGIDRIATAHTLDDQAETVVMRFARGAGTRGMAGIYPAVRGPESHLRLSSDDCRLEKTRAEDEEENKRSLDSGGQNRPASARDDKSVDSASGQDDNSIVSARVAGAIIRPLLEFRRAQLRHYLKRAGQEWREDASNQDMAFVRNRVRQEVMPKLRELNPAIEMVLSETAEIARAEEEYWREVVCGALREVSRGSHEGHAGHTKAAINIVKLMQLPLALRRRVLRAFAEQQGLGLEFHHVEQMLEVAAGAAGRSQKRVELIEGWDACFGENRLRLEKRAEKPEHSDYELALPIPGEVLVEAVGIVLRARLAESGKRLKAGELRVRNWRPGDRYWPAHSGSEKKVKELLQDRRVPAERKAAWPVVVSREEIVWVPGFEYPEKWVTESGEGVVVEIVRQA